MKTILQLCNMINIDIPKFCYHEQLSIAGNCRMCLVEVKGAIKPIASCASPLNNNMHILTNTKLVKKAREGVLEFLLLNHPLDCPICDQGGECDLQDQSLIFGNDRGRFYENKRSVNDKDCGPLIKTIMTRCIHCTRCIRFIDEFIGYKYFGLIGRGQNIEISNFLSKNINSELSGNLIDLCPVGALTSKPYSFISRPWELISWNTIDINDLLHINIRIDIRDSEILRVLPLFNDYIHEIWISDLTRFSYDNQKNNRIINPLKKEGANKFIIYSWEKVLNLILKKCLNSNLHFLIGDNIDSETALVIKKGKNYFNNHEFTINYKKLTRNSNNRKNYILDYNIYKELNEFKNIILININIRLEYPLLNIKLKRFKDLKLLNIYNIGTSYNQNYKNINYSSNLLEVKKFIEGKSLLNNIVLKASKNLILLNDNTLFNFLITTLKNLNLESSINIGFLNNLNINIIANELNLFNSLVKFNDYSFKKMIYKENNILYNLNNYNYNYLNYNCDYNIFQGCYLPILKEINNYDLLLPSITHYEKKKFIYKIYLVIVNRQNLFYFRRRMQEMIEKYYIYYLKQLLVMKRLWNYLLVILDYY